jgi:hypothetical protein
MHRRHIALTDCFHRGGDRHRLARRRNQRAAKSLADAAHAELDAHPLEKSGLEIEVDAAIAIRRVVAAAIAVACIAEQQRAYHRHRIA